MEGLGCGAAKVGAEKALPKSEGQKVFLGDMSHMLNLEICVGLDKGHLK